MPALVHAPPALTAAFTGIRGVDSKSESIDKNAISFLYMNKAYVDSTSNTTDIRPYLTYIRSVFQMSDQLTNMGAKSRKSKYMKWLNEEN
jgi:predicted acyl esterase